MRRALTGKAMDILQGLASPSPFGPPWATVLCSAVILGMLYWNVVALLGDTLPIHAALEKALTYIRQQPKPLTSKGLPQLNAALSGDPILGEAWAEFHETLLFKDPLKDPDAPVINTKQAGDFLNESTIVSRRMNTHWYAAVPGMLTAIGLIGTFLSIYLALSSLHLTAESQAQAVSSAGAQSSVKVSSKAPEAAPDSPTSMSQAGLAPNKPGGSAPVLVPEPSTGLLDSSLTAFINNLSGKFVSSIFGLGCAFLFVLLEKSSVGMAGIERSCSSLQAELNGLLKQAPQEILLNEISLKVGEMLKAVDNLKTELPACINEGLAVSVGNPVGQIVTQVQELARLADEQARKREESITRLVVQVVQSFKQALFDSTTKEFEALAATLTQTSGVVDSLNGKLAQSADQHEALIKANKDQIASLIKFQQEQADVFLAGSKEAQLQVIDGLRQHCDQLLKDQSTEMEALLASMETATGQMLKTNERLSDTLVEKQGGQLEKFLVQIEANSTKQLQLMTNSHEYMVNNLDTWITSATEDLEKLVRLIAEESQLVGQSVASVTTNITTLESIARANANMKAESAAAIDRVIDVLKSLSQATASAGQTSKQVDDLVASLADAHKEHQALLKAQSEFIDKYMATYQRLGLSQGVIGATAEAGETDRRGNGQRHQASDGASTQAAQKQLAAKGNLQDGKAEE